MNGLGSMHRVFLNEVGVLLRVFLYNQWETRLCVLADALLSLSKLNEMLYNKSILLIDISSVGAISISYIHVIFLEFLSDDKFHRN
jgi:hypothetical protein